MFICLPELGHNADTWAPSTVTHIRHEQNVTSRYRRCWASADSVTHVDD